MDCPKFGPAPDRFIGDQIAIRNAVPGFKSELKVTRCRPISKNDPAAARSPVGPPVEKPINPSQTKCKPIAS